MTISSATMAEIKRKASLGIPLTNPTPETEAMYKTLKKLGHPEAQNTGYNGAAHASYGSATTSTSDAERRREQVSHLVDSTIPEIADLQEKAKAEYVQTGKWNPAYTQQADAIRKMYNPAAPTGQNGVNEAQYEPVIFPDTPLLNLGGMGDAAKNVTQTHPGLVTVGALMLGFLLLKR